MKLAVRGANIEDRESIFALVKDFATSFIPEEQSFKKSFENIIQDENALLLVAELGNNIIGYCLGFDHYAFYANGRVSWIEEIMVRQEHRRSGVGDSLMCYFEQWAKSRQSRLVALATRRAAPFYNALDYEESAIFFRKLL